MTWLLRFQWLSFWIFEKLASSFHSFSFSLIRVCSHTCLDSISTLKYRPSDRASGSLFIALTPPSVRPYCHTKNMKKILLAQDITFLIWIYLPSVLHTLYNTDANMFELVFFVAMKKETYFTISYINPDRQTLLDFQKDYLRIYLCLTNPLIVKISVILSLSLSSFFFSRTRRTYYVLFSNPSFNLLFPDRPGMHTLTGKREISPFSFHE